MIIRYGLQVLLLLLPLASAAQSGAIVEGMQQPVWVQRGQLRLSLHPGQVLSAGDRVLTGSTGKLVLRLGEGSRVKLGVNADFSLDKLESETAEDVFVGFFRMVTGAFRFVTAEATKHRTRNVQIALGATATIGIRGTDVWGKVAEDGNFVVLLEGAVEISRAGEQILAMNKPMTIFDAPQGQAAKPVVAVDPLKLAQWALETELDQHQGILSENGVYSVYLYSSVNRQYAEKRSHFLQKEGYAADIHAVEINDVTHYRVGVTGFVSQEDAFKFIVFVRENFGINDAWLAKRQLRP